MNSILKTLLLDSISGDNSVNYSTTKCIEELLELSLALIQTLNKLVSISDKEHRDNIHSELADVEIQLERLKRVLDIDERQLYRAIHDKIKKFKTYKEEIGEDFGKLKKDKIVKLKNLV